MLKNAQNNLRKQQFAKALPSIKDLQEILKKNNAETSKEEKFVKLEIFTKEAYFTCIYQIALQLTQQQEFEQAQPYLKILEKGVDTDFTLAIDRMNSILEQEHLKSLHDQAKEVHKKLMELELSSLILLISSSNIQINEEVEDISATSQLQIKIDDCLKLYQKIKAEIINGKVNLTGFVDSEEERTEVLKKILSIPGVKTIIDKLQQNGGED